VKLRDPAALALDRLLSEPDRLLVTVLLVTNLMNIFALTLATQELVRYFGIAGYLVVGIAAFPVYYVGLELLPKSLFRRFPYRALAALAGLLRLANLALTPLHFVGGVVSRAIARRRPVEGQKLFLAREEFKYLTIESERTGR
jgi:Mg2+/Co2+ transporter CorB